MLHQQAFGAKHVLLVLVAKGNNFDQSFMHCLVIRGGVEAFHLSFELFAAIEKLFVFNLKVSDGLLVDLALLTNVVQLLLPLADFSIAFS